MYKKMWVTDIDRTIVYSTGFLKEFPSDGENVVVEKCRDDFFGYMDKQVQERLTEYVKDNLFVPVTSRTVDQYKRLQFGFTPKYAVTSIGGTILEDGQPVKEWQDFVMDNKNTKNLPIVKEAIEIIGGCGEVKLLDGCYLFFKTEADFSEEVNSRFYKSYNLYRQGKKNYIIPKHISKINAVNWLKNQLGIEKIAASGDSMLDMDMLRNADLAMVPDSSYIKDIIEEEGFKMAKGGIKSPLEMINMVSKL